MSMKTNLRLLIHIGGVVDGSLSKALNSADTRLGKVSRVTGVVGKSLTKGLTLPIGTLLGASVKAASGFEYEMSRVKAISGSTGSSFNKLKNQALKLGQTTIFSAKEVAGGMEDLAAAGFSTKQIMKAIPGTVYMAAAAGSSLANSVDITSSAIRGFGLKASDAGHVADVLALNANKTNAAIEDTGEALKYVSPIAKTTGMSMESVTAAIGIMANAGVKGTQAGTTLRGALVRLIRPTKMVQGALDKLGVSVYDSKGKMLPLYDIISKLKKATAGMSQQERNQQLAKIFGTNALSGMNAIMNAGPKQLKKLTTMYEHADGQARKAAEIMMDNYRGSLKKLKGAMGTAMINIGEAMEPTIRGIMKNLTNLINAFNGLPHHTQAAITKFLVAVAAVGPALSIFARVTRDIDTVKKAIDGLSDASKLKNFAVKLKDVASDFLNATKGMKTATSTVGDVTTVARTWNAPLTGAESVGGTKGFIKRLLGRNKMIAAAQTAGTAAESEAIVAGTNISKFKMAGIKASAAFKTGLLYNRVTGAFNLAFVKPIQGGMKLISKMGKGLSKIFSVAMAHPAVLGIMAIVTVIILLYKYHNKLAKVAKKTWEKFAKWVGLPKSQTKRLEKTFNSLHKALQRLFHALGLDSKQFKTFSKGMRAVASVAKQIFAKGLGAAFAAAVSVVVTAVNSLVITIRTIVKVITRVVKIIKDIAHHNWKAAWHDFLGIFTDAWKGMYSQLKNIVNGMIDVINIFFSHINSIHVPNSKLVPKSWRGAHLHLPTIPHVATGGLVATEGIAQISERGGEIVDLPRGSRVYPHDLSERYLKRMASQKPQTDVNVSYSPVINIQGNANKDDIKNALKISERDFEKLMHRYKRRQQAISFKGSYA